MYSVHQWFTTFLTRDPLFIILCNLYQLCIGHEKEKKAKNCSMSINVL